LPSPGIGPSEGRRHGTARGSDRRQQTGGVRAPATRVGELNRGSRGRGPGHQSGLKVIASRPGEPDNRVDSGLPVAPPDRGP
jgi:hypothetical protein